MRRFLAAAALLALSVSAVSAAEKISYKILVDMPSLKVKLDDMERLVQELRKVVEEEGRPIEAFFTARLPDGDSVRTTDVTGLHADASVPSRVHGGLLNVRSGQTFVTVAFEKYSNYYSIDTPRQDAAHGSKIALQKFIRRHRLVYPPNTRTLFLWGVPALILLAALPALFFINRAAWAGRLKKTLYAAVIALSLGIFFYVSANVDSSELFPAFTLIVRDK